MSRTCGGPGWSWPHCTEQPATPPAGSTPRSLVLSLDNADDSWLRMRRTHRSRAVLWGRSALAPPSPPDARRGRSRLGALRRHRGASADVPGVVRPRRVGHQHLLPRRGRPPPPAAVAHRRPARGGARPPREADAGGAQGLRQRRSPRRRPTELVRLAGADAPPTSVGSVRSRLRDQIHGQMRDAHEVDRMLMQRPPSLVQWSRDQRAGRPVPARRAGPTQGQLTPARTNTRIPRARGAHPDQRAADPAP